MLPRYFSYRHFRHMQGEQMIFLSFCIKIIKARVINWFSYIDYHIVVVHGPLIEIYIPLKATTAYQFSFDQMKDVENRVISHICNEPVENLVLPISVDECYYNEGNPELLGMTDLEKNEEVFIYRIGSKSIIIHGRARWTPLSGSDRGKTSGKQYGNKCQ